MRRNPYCDPFLDCFKIRCGTLYELAGNTQMLWNGRASLQNADQAVYCFLTQLPGTVVNAGELGLAAGGKGGML